MRSLIILEVEHGDTNDPLHQLIDEAQEAGYNVPDLKIIDYTVRVDLPACFVLDSDSTTKED